MERAEGDGEDLCSLVMLHSKRADDDSFLFRKDFGNWFSVML
jgi:hypothetical protein